MGRLAGGAAEAAVWLGVILALRSFLVFEDCLFEERPKKEIENNVKKLLVTTNKAGGVGKLAGGRRKPPQGRG